jgi:hypothetical protein
MKTIIIDSNRYVLPESMSTKDVQALAGFLITLQRVQYEYIWGTSGGHAYYTDGSAVISLGDVELVTKEKAKADSDASRAAYEAKKEAEKAT